MSSPIVDAINAPLPFPEDLVEAMAMRLHARSRHYDEVIDYFALPETTRRRLRATARQLLSLVVVAVQPEPVRLVAEIDRWLTAREPNVAAAIVDELVAAMSTDTVITPGID